MHVFLQKNVVRSILILLLSISFSIWLISRKNVNKKNVFSVLTFILKKKQQRVVYIYSTIIIIIIKIVIPVVFMINTATIATKYVADYIYLDESISQQTGTLIEIDPNLSRRNYDIYEIMINDYYFNVPRTLVKHDDLHLGQKYMIYYYKHSKLIYYIRELE